MTFSKFVWLTLYVPNMQNCLNPSASDMKLVNYAEKQLLYAILAEKLLFVIVLTWRKICVWLTLYVPIIQNCFNPSASDMKLANYVEKWWSNQEASSFSHSQWRGIEQFWFEINNFASSTWEPFEVWRVWIDKIFMIDSHMMAASKRLNTFSYYIWKLCKEKCLSFHLFV